MVIAHDNSYSMLNVRFFFQAEHRSRLSLTHFSFLLEFRLPAVTLAQTSTYL